MTARYLIRLDDACHTMNRSKWAAVEAILDRAGIKPIVGVIPDNQDPSLQIEPRDDAFWEHVRAWQGKGWTIGMHGYQHRMHFTDAELLLPFYRRSEFAGLSLEEQALKITQSWRLFGAQNIEPQIWVAPAHCFDWLTLQAIRAETSIRVISDGIAVRSYYEHGFHWIPQQLWSLTQRMFGLWTVCLHPNTMTEAGLAAFERAVREDYGHRIVGFAEVQFGNAARSIFDHCYGRYFWWRRNRT